MFEYRSSLFIPGANQKLLARAGEQAADLVIFDLEDSVLEAEKTGARTLVAECLSSVRSERSHFGVRVNALDTEHTLADLEAVLPAKPDLIMLPKAETGKDLQHLDEMLNTLEAKLDIPQGSTKIIILSAETPASLFNFNSLSNNSKRMLAMTWGPEDLATALGAQQGRDDRGNWLPPLQLAQTLCLAKASELGVQAIDTVMADFKNLDGLRAECLAAKQLGFTGKLAIHPAQLEVINDVFNPSEAELGFAKRVVALFADNPGVGALQLDGKMVDIPHLRLAERVLARGAK